MCSVSPTPSARHVSVTTITLWSDDERILLQYVLIAVCKDWQIQPCVRALPSGMQMHALVKCDLYRGIEFHPASASASISIFGLFLLPFGLPTFLFSAFFGRTGFATTAVFLDLAI